MDPRADIDTGEDKILWPMVRIEQFFGRQVRCIVTIHSELSQFFVWFSDNAPIISLHTASNDKVTIMNYNICAGKYYCYIFSTILHLLGGNEKLTIIVVALSSLPSIFEQWTLPRSSTTIIHPNIKFGQPKTYR